jgi:hypothetical protein
MYPARNSLRATDSNSPDRTPRTSPELRISPRRIARGRAQQSPQRPAMITHTRRSPYSRENASQMGADTVTGMDVIGLTVGQLRGTQPISGGYTGPVESDLGSESRRADFRGLSGHCSHGCVYTSPGFNPNTDTSNRFEQPAAAPQIRYGFKHRSAHTLQALSDRVSGYEAENFAAHGRVCPTASELNSDQNSYTTLRDVSLRGPVGSGLPGFTRKL